VKRRCAELKDARRARQALAAVLLGLPALHAAALWDEKLSFIVADTVTHDDNVFRLADGADPRAVGAASKGDVYNRLSAGVELDVATDAQRLEADFELTRYRFDEFGALDLDGHDVRAAWRWRAGRRFVGELGHVQSEALASLSNIQSGARSATPNFIDLRRTHATVAYRLLPSWELRADVAALAQRNEAVEYRPSDLGARRRETAIAYVSRSGSRLGLRAHSLDGRLPNRQLIGGTAVDNSYLQHGVEAFVEWQTTSQSRFTAHGGPVERHYATFGERNFDGFLYRAAFEWQPTESLLLTAAAQRDIGSNEEVNVGFVLSEGVGLYGRWDLRAAITLSFDVEANGRTYLGEVDSALRAAAPRFEDWRLLGLRLALRPNETVTIDVGWQRQDRSSQVALSSYDARIASVGARLRF
jgi:exopolysaccharide biosynthesis operon protein EpsL